MNGPLASQGRREGTYEISNLVNGKPSWVSNTQAIWFVPKHKDWAIGYKSKIGSSIRGISSLGNHRTVDPDNIPGNWWQYYSGNRWSLSNAKDIIIQCIGMLEYITSFCYNNIKFCSSIESALYQNPNCLFIINV